MALQANWKRPTATTTIWKVQKKDNFNNIAEGDNVEFDGDLRGQATDILKVNGSTWGKNCTYHPDDTITVVANHNSKTYTVTRKMVFLLHFQPPASTGAPWTALEGG